MTSESKGQSDSEIKVETQPEVFSTLHPYPDIYYDDDEWYEDDADDFEMEEEDSGMLGSMMEAVLVHYEKGKCRQCNKDMEEKPPAESFCSQTCKDQWQILLDARIKIGLNDLERRGYD